MSGIVKGLANLEKFVDNQAPKKKSRWVRLEDGASVRITFLQELDEDSRNYNAAAGVAFIATEHYSPKDYRRKALCTIDEGRCYGCEANIREPKVGWRARGRLYVNVLVDDGKEDPYVAILSQGVAGKSITPSLLMWAGENESITDSSFRLRRTGMKTATEYSLMPLPKTSGLTPEEINALELIDVEGIVSKVVPYDEQRAFYEGEEAHLEQREPPSNSDMEW